MSNRVENIRVTAIARELSKLKISILRKGLTNQEGEIKTGMAYQMLEYFVKNRLIAFPPLRSNIMDSKKLLTARGRAVLLHLDKMK